MHVLGIRQCADLALAALLVLAGCSSTSLPPTPPSDTAVALTDYAKPIDRSRAALAPVLAEYPGVTVAVAVNGRIVWSEGLGWSDVVERKPATPATRFRVYSDTKPLTAVLALRLAEQGRLDLDAPIGRTLPGLPVATQAITLRQLLAHLGGIRDYGDGEWMDVSQAACTSTAQGLAPFVEDPLLHAPGAHFAYSSFGYVLASAAIEAATRSEYARLLDREVLQPAAMRDTGPEREGMKALATPYDTAVFGRVAVAPQVDNSCKAGAGMLVGTSEDFARFGVALATGNLLDPAARAAMTTASVASLRQERPYGMGIGVGDDPALGPLWMHSGGGMGGRAFLLVAPERGLVVAILGNIEGASLGTSALAIAQAFLVR